MKYFKRISLLAIFLFALTVNAQDDKDYINEPGYVDFGTLTSFYKGDEVTEVFLDEHLLKMMSKLSGENDSEMKILLRGLKLVKVYSFKVPKDSSLKVRSKIGDIDKKLLKEKWYRIIKIKEKVQERRRIVALRMTQEAFGEVDVTRSMAFLRKLQNERKGI